MTIGSFKDADAERFFKTGKAPKKKAWALLKPIVRRKLDMLSYAGALHDLASPPGNRLEALRGNLAGWYSIRINDQWRIIFRWEDRPMDVQIVDYH